MYACTVLITFSHLETTCIPLYTLCIFWKCKVCNFQNWQSHIEKRRLERTRLIQKRRIWKLFSSCYRHFLKRNFSVDESFLSHKILPEKFFIGLLDVKQSKMLILGIFFLTIPEQNLSWSLIYYIKKLFWQIFGSVTYSLVIAQFQVQYDQYFLSFAYFADLIHELLGEWSNSKSWEIRKIFARL